MRPRHTLAFAAALSVCSTLPVHAQRTALEMADATTPACAETGVPRVAVMVPPGKTMDEIRTAVAQGGMFPEGTQVVILNLGEYTSMQNQEEFSRRMNLVLTRFLDEGTRIDGTLSVLLTVDETGQVTDAKANTGNRHVDRMLGNAWKQARFDPYAIGGCRMKAWISVPLSFSSDFSWGERRVEVRATPTPR
ncbi:MAG TPA: energy transducer TonB [Longimicrobium sp.]|nr:energy transducer TonB [Longimicrobium sp.]